MRALEGTTPHLARLEAIYLLALAVAASGSGGQPRPAAQAGVPRTDAALEEFASWSSSALLTLALAVIHPLLALAPTVSVALSSACAPFSKGVAGTVALGRLAGSQLILLVASMGLAERARQVSPGPGAGGVAERWRSTVEFLRGDTDGTRGLPDPLPP
ncbi:MAG: hypothetical protein QI223_02330 [Candidatus Korarchaeota archaeon]|nr:hypothetical protein [Candidatus Korarchaeota archaeon]